MSNPRLLLVSGAPGAGASTVARALARSATSRGEQAHLIERATVTPSPDIIGLLEGLDPLLGEAVAGLPALRTMQGLVDAVRRSADAPDATVVWDAGPVDSLLADLAALDALTVAANRVSGSVIAIAASVAGDRLRVLRRVQAELAEALQGLRGVATGIVLVDQPASGLRARLRGARAHAGLLGLSVDLVVVNRVPRRRDGWPADWSSARRRRADAASDLGMTTQAIRWFLDDADEESVVRRVAKRLPRVPGRTSVDEHLVAADALSVDEADGGYRLCIPMPYADPSSVRAGLLGDVLIVEVAGLRRMLALPSVLRRCTVDGGGIIGDDLVLRFTPDPARWRVAS